MNEHLIKPFDVRISGICFFFRALFEFELKSCHYWAQMTKNRRAKKKKSPTQKKNVVDIEKSSSQKVAHMVGRVVKHPKNREGPITLKKSLEVGQGGTSKKIFISIFKNIGSQGFPRFF